MSAFMFFFYIFYQNAMVLFSFMLRSSLCLINSACDHILPSRMHMMPLHRLIIIKTEKHT